ncbi:MAG: exodeoxyribonuclease V subunit gamma [Pseudohongiella nitratireducens]|nr:exodeoxyribonuclease V subunit gamma [Pseudohongiella nitratireducens]MDF1622388.1 exodeoxyribonuclease V subunit gamma [Pseudohongiella nitratireducens]
MAVDDANNIESGFMVLHSNRIESLRSLLVDWLRKHPLEPLENEVMLVQSNGIAQWLQLSLAKNPDADQPGCGIAAAMEITLPGRYHWQAYRSVLGNLPAQSPYDKDQLTWRIFRLLPDLLTEPTFAALKYFLADSSDGRKRFQLAGRLADLLDQYQVYRADWLSEWSAGDDQYTRRETWQAIPESESWQPALWRSIVNDIHGSASGVANDDKTIDALSSRAQIHQHFLNVCKQLAEQGNRPQGLPRRIVVFGLSSLPRQSLEVLSALSAFTQVLLFVHNPCQFYWGDIIDPVQAQRWFAKPFRRQAHKQQYQTSDLLSQDTQYLQSNPLLASWGKQGRDYIRLLDEHDERKHYESMFHENELSIDVFEPPEESTLLGQVQSDIYHLRSVTEAMTLAQSHHSEAGLSFHLAHGKQREVEVLQDQLLSWLEADPTLKPRDILVMVPDINEFAPHIQAVFAGIDHHDERYIPFSISDQGQRSQSLLMQAFEMLLNIAHSRLPVTDVLDLLDVPALRQAFGLSEEDIALLNQWIEGAGVRWGFNAEHRITYGFAAEYNPDTLTLNTWLFGLKRMLLGYASGSRESWQSVEPYTEVGGLGAASVGKLAHLISELEHLWQLFLQPAQVTTWVERIHQLMQTFFTVSDDADQAALNRIAKRLEQWQATSELAAFDDAIEVSIVHDHLQDLFEQRELSQRFLSGSLNFASLMPMRAIPFRRICLLGMNDADYPRQVTYSDFDLMRDDYRPGDRSRREDDRYLFLEAMLSAREHLYISWSAYSITDNAFCPPSVLVAQLRDYLTDTRGQRLLEAVTHSYPLQPFSARYFDLDSQLSTFAREWEPPEIASDAVHQPAQDESASAESSTQAQEPISIGLAELSQMMRNPAQEFFRQCLHVNFAKPDEEQSIDEPFSLSNLERWQVNQSILEQSIYRLAESATQSASTLNRMMDQIQASGTLPLPPFDREVKQQIAHTISHTLEQIHELLSRHSRRLSLTVSVQAEQGHIQLEDSIADVWAASDDTATAIRLVNTGSSIWAGKQGNKGKPKWHYIARHWPYHLACQLNGPVTTWLVSAESSSALLPLTPEQARQELQTLMMLYASNLQAPLVAEPATSCALIASCALIDGTATDAKKDAGTDAGSEKSTESLSTYDARIAYEGNAGNDRSFPAVQNSYALQRLWPDFDSLLAATTPYRAEEASGPATDIPQIEDSLLYAHSQSLYRAMCEHWHHSRAQLNKAEVS